MTTTANSSTDSGSSDYIIDDGDALVVRRPATMTDEQWADLQRNLDELWKAKDRNLVMRPHGAG